MPASTVPSPRATSQRTSGPQSPIGKTSPKKRPIKKMSEAIAALKAKNTEPAMKANGQYNDVLRRRLKACEHLLPACHAKMKKYPACQQMVKELDEVFACRCSCHDLECRDKLIVAILEILVTIGKDRHSYKKYENIGELAFQAAEYAMSSSLVDIKDAFVRVRQLASDQARIVGDELESKRPKQHYAEIID